MCRHLYSKSSNKADQCSKKISPNLKLHYSSLYYNMCKKLHYFKEIAQIIDITRFRIGPPIFLWQVPVRIFAPKTHLDVIGTYRKPRTSSTTFENPDFRNFRIRFPLPVLIKNPGNLMLVPEIPSNFGQEAHK